MNLQLVILLHFSAFYALEAFSPVKYTATINAVRSYKTNTISYHHSALHVRNKLFGEDTSMSKKNITQYSLDLKVDEEANLKMNSSSFIAVALDVRIPKSKSILPTSLNSCPEQLLGKIDSLFHASSHANNKNIVDHFRQSHFNPSGDENITNGVNTVPHVKLLSAVRKGLEDSGFVLLKKIDLDLCEKLNAGYLLSLPISPDLKDLDPSLGKDFYPEMYPNNSISSVVNEQNKNQSQSLLFDGNVLIFRRGYSQEITRGFLVLSKLDYLQSSLVQRSIGQVERRVENFLIYWGNTIKQESKTTLKKTMSKAFDIKNGNKTNITSERDNKEIKYANKNLKLGRYGGIVPSISTRDMKDALDPYLVNEVEYQVDGQNLTFDYNQSMLYSNLSNNFNFQDDEMNFTPSQLLRRVSIANLVDFFSIGGRRRLAKSLFSESELVEPTYEEVVVVWRPKKKKEKAPTKPPAFVYDMAQVLKMKDRLPKYWENKPQAEFMPLEIRAFAMVPMSNILAVMPKTKLIFRPGDAFIFDTINIFGLLAVLASQKFDNPKLDFIALISVSIWVLRTFFRYSNKLARYDLLVNKFLTSKIAHRNDGALKFILDEAATQKATRAALVHYWLLQYQETNKDNDVLTRDNIIKFGMLGLNELLQTRSLIHIDINGALEDLIVLGLIKFSVCESTLLDVQEIPSAAKLLKESWVNLFEPS